MKKLIMGLLIVSSLSLISCANQNVKYGVPTKADTPTNTAMLVKNAFDTKDYESFKKLFSEGKRESLTEEKFKELQELSTNGASFGLYSTLTFDDGGMLLVRMTTEKWNGEYKIEDVMVIPDEMKDFFSYN